MFQFDDGTGSLPTHVMNGILVSKPIRPLDSIVHMPTPVVLHHRQHWWAEGNSVGEESADLRHVSESRVDSALGGDGVRTSGEEFSDAGSVESCFGKTECSS